MAGPEAAVSSAIAVQGTLRFLQLSLHLYAYLFPQEAIVKNNERFDFVIVGGGSAGCVLATRLTDNSSVNVLLIEAGGDPTIEVMTPGLALYTRRSQFDWNYTSIDDGYAYQCYKNKGFEMTRGHGLGGSSGVNFMVYARGNPFDYNQWADIVNETQYNFDNLLPYFKKGEHLQDETTLNSKYANLYGTKGEVGINKFPDPAKEKYLKALDEIGYKTVLDVNGNETLGFNFPMFTVANGTRQSSCFCHMSPVRDRTNLFVLRNTKVTKILFNGTRAIGVQTINNKNVTRTIRARLEVLLSAGALNTPQLLMLSGIGPKDDLTKLNITTKVDLPVGKNLQDHNGVFVAYQTDSYANSTVSLFNPFTPALNAIIGYIPKNKNVTYPDIQHIMGTAKNPDAFEQFFAFTLFMANDIAQRAYDATAEREIFFSYVLNLRPFSRGNVTLLSADINDAPQVHLGAYSDDRDLVKIIAAVKDYLRIENSTYFKRVNAKRIDLTGDRCSSFAQDSDEYWRCYALCLTVSIYHFTSTCSMGTVVDNSMRVFGTTGLRVVDASVYPITPSANINAPTMMLAEKASDLIKAAYKL